MHKDLMKKILRLVIADDEPYIRTNLKALFPWRELGYEISASFSNGLDALNYLETIGADVLLTDIQMPVMDGCEAARHIRALPRPDAASIWIVAMSANAFLEDVRLSRASGMNEHISKPVDLDRLLETLRSHLKPTSDR